MRGVQRPARLSQLRFRKNKSTPRGGANVHGHAPPRFGRISHHSSIVDPNNNNNNHHTRRDNRSGSSPYHLRVANNRRKGVPFSQCADVSFQQKVVDAKSGKARHDKASHLAATGQDGGAMLNFMRAVHRAQPLVGDGTTTGATLLAAADVHGAAAAVRSGGGGGGGGRARIPTSALAVRRSKRGLPPTAKWAPPTAVDESGNVLAMSSTSQVYPVAKLPNMYPFNTGKTRKGLYVCGCGGVACLRP